MFSLILMYMYIVVVAWLLPILTLCAFSSIDNNEAIRNRRRCAGGVKARLASLGSFRDGRFQETARTFQISCN
jgi:hypothetical protein